MNYLVLDSEHFVSDYYSYQDAEARELIKQHDLKLGLNISAILYNQSRGTAHIKSISKNSVEITYQESTYQLAKNPVSLIIGLCRPQTVKKVLQLSMTLGIAEIIFLFSANSEKNYLYSKIWEERQLKHDLSLGMAQSGDYLAPRIIIERNFTDYFNSFLLDPLNQTSGKFLATTKVESRLVSIPSLDKTILAIGPEKGWKLEEETIFLDNGFLPVNYGPRMLRIEQAMAYGLGQLNA